MCKATVVIAAYNIENYIEKCLYTVTKQTLEDIEIIIVNDGSTDKTLDRINDLANNDERIKIINKENAGVVEARKSGYDEATGEYILFIDGDDWISHNTIELLYNKAISGNYDIVCNNYKYAFDNGTFSDMKQKVTKDLKKGEFLEQVMLEGVFANIWSKFIKKEFIDRNKIIFPSSMVYGEDLAMLVMLAINNPSVTFVQESLYFYYQRMSSVTNIVTEKIFDINKAVEFIKKSLDDANLYNKYIKEFEFMVFNHNLNYRMKIILNNKKYSRRLYDVWKMYEINLSDNKYIQGFLDLEGKVTMIGIRILDFNYQLGRIYFILKNSLKRKK